MAPAGVTEWLSGARAEVSAQPLGWDQPEVAAEEQKQAQGKYLETLHWTMTALYSLQLSNFQKDVRSSLSY